MKNQTCIAGMGFALMLAASTAHAEYTPKLTITMVDAVAPGSTYVTLNGYTNTACDNSRMLINTTNADYYKQMIAMVLAALHAGTPVQFEFSVNANQCVVTRLFSHKD